MADEIKQKILIDLDVYGRTSSSGGALIHSNDFAISNAIIFFLTSKRGDYLYRSSLGGVLDKLLFKLLDPIAASSYASELTNTLTSEFGALIQGIQASITPDYENRYYLIEVYYISNLSGESNLVNFYTKPKSEVPITIVYQDVDFEGDNLLAFIAVQKESLGDEKLIFNPNDNYWYWGNFRFTNFSAQSSNFEEIFSIIND
jgi:hypothetical protein